MEIPIPGRRSDYSLLSQLPDEQPPKICESLSSDVINKQKTTDRSPPFDWLIVDNGRIGSHFPSIGLQRQSSGGGSSFGDASLSGDHHLPILSAADPDLSTQEEGSKAACADSRSKADAGDRKNTN